MNKLMKIAAITTPLLLAACGGGDGDLTPPVATNEVPANAMASPTAFSHYVGSLAADDQAEPLDVDRIDPPASETEEPIDVN